LTIRKPDQRRHQVPADQCPRLRRLAIGRSDDEAIEVANGMMASG
jgi:hypothetical protein